MSSRRGRRRRERERARGSARVVHRMSALARLGLAAAGGVLIVGGIALLAGGNSGTAERLGRLAGILIVIGLVLAGAAAVGRT